MARATGIQITDSGVRVVEVDGSPKSYKILGAAEVPIESTGQMRPDPEALGDAVRTALREVKAKREFLVLGLPAKEATIREIVVPFTDNDQIRKIIKFECEANLPTTEIDQVIVGWYKIAEVGPRSRLLIFAVEKAAIRHYLEGLARVGIEPGQVDLDCAALWSWSQLTPAFVDAEDDPRAHVILDLGATSSTLLVTRGGKLRFVRAMRTGSDSITRSLTHDLGISDEEARRITRGALAGETLPFATAGDLEAQGPSTALAPAALQKDIVQDRHTEFAKRLVNEVRRSLSSIQIEGGLGGIHLTGPAATSATVERALQEAFRVEVFHLDPLLAPEHSLGQEEGQWIAAPIGLALKAFEHDPVGLEFRQEEFTFARRFERLRTPLLILGLALLMTVGFLLIGELNKLREIKKRTNVLAQYADEVFEILIKNTATGNPRLLPVMGFESADDVDQVFERLQSKAADRRITEYLKFLEGETGPLERMRADYGVLAGDNESEPPPETITTSALVRLDQFLGCFARVQEQIKPFTIDKLNVNNTTISWNMKSGTLAFDTLKAEFEKLPGYDKAQPANSGTSRSRGDLFEYTGCTLNFEREDR